MQVGVVRSELAARASGCGFGEPPKPNGQRLVSAFGLVPSQLRIGGAALGGKGVRITNPRHGWLPACAAKNSPSHGLLCPQRPVARLWGAGHTAWSCEIEAGQNGFGEPPKPTGQRPVLPMTAAAQGEAGAVWGLLLRLGLSLCGRFGFPAFCASGFLWGFGFGASDLGRPKPWRRPAQRWRHQLTTETPRLQGCILLEPGCSNLCRAV